MNKFKFEAIVDYIDSVANIDARMEMANMISDHSGSLYEVHRMEDFKEVMSYLPFENMLFAVQHSKDFNPMHAFFWLDAVEGSDNLHSADEPENVQGTRAEEIAKYCVDNGFDCEDDYIRDILVSDESDLQKQMVAQIVTQAYKLFEHNPHIPLAEILKSML
ncbi:MAG: hypothetical protein Q4Q25_01305 [Methanocorpusculum sp.]|nr:hypothetical protein [Methanocorpusculum sp.]